MKKLIIIPFVALLGACSNPERDLVENHIQKLGDSQVDIDVEWQSFEEIEPITTNDSVTALLQSLSSKWSDDTHLTVDSLAKVKQTLLEVSEGWTEFKEAYDSWDPKTQSTMRSRHDRIRRQAETASEMLRYVERIEGYNEGEILAHRYRAVYDFKNPVLDARQSRVDTFLLSPDKSTVLTR